MGLLQIGLFTWFMGLKRCSWVGPGATDPTESSGGSSESLSTNKGVELERSDLHWEVVDSVEIVHSGKIQPKYFISRKNLLGSH